MRFLLRLPIIRTLHKRQLLFPTGILIVVAGVLVQGALERNQPETVESERDLDESVPVPEPRAILRTDLEKTPLTYFSDYWSQLAEGARDNLVAIGSTASPGILIGPRLALTSAQPAMVVLAERTRLALTRESPGDSTAAVEAAETGTSDSARDDAMTDQTVPPLEEVGPHRLRAWDETIGLALFDVSDVGETAFTLSDPRRLASGSYLGAVTLDRTGEPTITPGYLVAAGADDLTISMNLPSTLSVAAIIDLDGAMVGLAYASPDGPRVVTTTEMLGLIAALQTKTLCRSIEVSDLADDVQRRLGIEGGVLVEYVHPEAFAGEPSLRGGDVLLEWGDTRLESAEQFASLYDAQASGSLIRHRVLRGLRRVTGGTIMPAANCAPATPEPVRLPRFGLAVRWLDRSDPDAVPSEGWYAVAVAPGGPAAAAGLQERDHLRAIDGQPVDSEDDRVLFEAAAASDESILLSLLRDGRARLVAVPPEAADVIDTESNDDGTRSER